jgi:hypothetical protein
MLGVFAEFETNLRRERQMEGIARAKASGIYARKGRPASIDAARVREMKAQGLRGHCHRQGARHRSGERLSSIVGSASRRPARIQKATRSPQNICIDIASAGQSVPTAGPFHLRTLTIASALGSCPKVQILLRWLRALLVGFDDLRATEIAP